MFMYKCPVPGCNHVGEHITTVHMRLHGCASRKEFQRKYGRPIELNTHISPAALRWARRIPNPWANVEYVEV